LGGVEGFYQLPQLPREGIKNADGWAVLQQGLQGPGFSRTAQAKKLGMVIKDGTLDMAAASAKNSC
jgi:hypothetical protein